jgi:hypothetical protein
VKSASTDSSILVTSSIGIQSSGLDAGVAASSAGGKHGLKAHCGVVLSVAAGRSVIKVLQRLLALRRILSRIASVGRWGGNAPLAIGKNRKHRMSARSVKARPNLHTRNGLCFGGQRRW